MSRRYLVRDRATGQVLGVALVITGAYLLYEAYEKRGGRRPFLLRFIPGGSL